MISLVDDKREPRPFAYLIGFITAFVICALFASFCLNWANWWFAAIVGGIASCAAVFFIGNIGEAIFFCTTNLKDR